MLHSLSKYAQAVIDQYAYTLPFVQALAIGFDGSASQSTRPIYLGDVPDDVLLTEIQVDFTNAQVLISVEDVNGYKWSDDYFPVQALAGVATQVMPVLPLPIEYKLEKNSKLKLTFKNSAASPTTGGTITWRGLRLKQQPK